MTVPIDIQDEDHFEELLGEAFLRKNLLQSSIVAEFRLSLNNFHAIDTIRKNLQILREFQHKIFHDHARVVEFSP